MRSIVGRYTILVNGLSFILILATIPPTSVNFWIASSLFLVGLIAIIADVLKKTRKRWVAFSLGSKTLGALSIYVASGELGWIQNFGSIVRSMKTADAIVSSTEAHVAGFLLIFGTVYILGLIAWFISKLGQKGYISRDLFFGHNS